ncbi:hypothetical protein L486_01766 [Kwoniella mangroviensis CBS 10435]|uniref:Uncharacterized protein n=1 Tax=Kwoniella mangroviensis CBS 10435 TaxID=1331196 RepID=A0A1B9J2V3_9TREE|nr:hypothetical protein L486_01766 [Kwoniella mangroviensis CBS 10435]
MGGVSSALDPARGRGAVSVPDGYTTPSFPSLYLPTLDDTANQRGIFLYEAEAIWHFTLYWTLLLLGSLFLICSIYASLTIFINITTYRDKQSDHSRDIPSLSKKMIVGKRIKSKRPPLWPIFILPVISVVIASGISLISATVVGFALAAIYSAGGFSMSTSYSTLTSIL